MVILPSEKKVSCAPELLQVGSGKHHRLLICQTGPGILHRGWNRKMQLPPGLFLLFLTEAESCRVKAAAVFRC